MSREPDESGGDVHRPRGDLGREFGASKFDYVHCEMRWKEIMGRDLSVQDLFREYHIKREGCHNQPRARCLQEA